MTIHGESFPWKKKPKFIGPKLDFEKELYDNYGLIGPSINFDLDDAVARRTEELLRDMYEKTVSMLKTHVAALSKTVKVSMVGFSCRVFLFIVILVHCIARSMVSTVQVLLDNKEISGDQIEFILNSYPAETPVKLILEEKDPGSLPFFEVDGDRDTALPKLIPVGEVAAQ